MQEHPNRQTVIDEPLVSFGREICGDLQAGLRREWLVTNGLGGFASGTVAGVNTRRYHGLLVAALSPPAERTVLVGGLVEWATYDGRRYPLSAHEYGDGTVDPHGYRHLESFRLEGTLPIWRFALGDALLERRVWMPYGANTTYISYRLLRGSARVDLQVTPLVTYRDFHGLSRGAGWHLGVEARPDGAAIHAFDGARPLYLLNEGASFTESGSWYWNFRHAEETARGLDDRSDLFAPGAFDVTLAPGERWTLALTTEPNTQLDADALLTGEQDRQRQLLNRAGVETAHPVAQQLTLAADQFIVERSQPAGAEEPGKTVIAGYHWFGDWGRDTMISLPGLTLATARPEDAAGILRTFARFVADGLLPNNFPDHPGVDPGYNTAGASLWYVLAIRAYQQATGDVALVDELLPVVRGIVDAHIRGTQYRIGVDPADGLLHAGEPGVQLTWMDAKVGDWVVTPRIGKPVEINALWYNVLRTLAEFLEERAEDSTAKEYGALADRVQSSFHARFVRPGQMHLADVVDGPDGDELRIRPNQIFAVSLPFPILEGDEARAVVDAVGRELLTSYGLRSLGSGDPAYRGDYGGDQVRRDGGYHQGPVWTWLIGAYAEAHYRVYGDPVAALGLLQPFGHHLLDAGLGTVSEILEGDAPHLPRGCVAQAWGVAEVLRMWRELESAAESAHTQGSEGRKSSNGGLTVTAADNKTVARRYFEEVLDGGNPTAADELLAPDHLTHLPGIPALDREGLKQFIPLFRAAFPDLHHSIEYQVAEGDKVVTGFTIHGTQLGEFQGMPPTGRKVIVPGISTHRIAGDAISEQWVQYDVLGMLQQLGAMPSAEEARA